MECVSSDELCCLRVSVPNDHAYTYRYIDLVGERNISTIIDTSSTRFIEKEATIDAEYWKKLLQDLPNSKFLPTSYNMDERDTCTLYLMNI